MKKRLAMILSATALAVAAFASAAVAYPAASAGPPLATHEEYVPFVTDFPKPVAAVDPATPSPRPAAGTSGTDWGDVGTASGIGAALVALLAGSVVVLTRRAKPARS